VLFIDKSNIGMPLSYLNETYSLTRKPCYRRENLTIPL